MARLFLWIVIIFLFQDVSKTISPNGKYKLIIETKEENDLQVRYITKLLDIKSETTIEIANCIRRDLESPNFYWSNDSRYLVFEQCSESFKDSRISILNLQTKKVTFELVGLSGNYDKGGEQFDSANNILIYFDTSTDYEDKIPPLYAFDLKTKMKQRICEFEVSMDMEFPQVVRVKGKRQIRVAYTDNISNLRITRLLDY